MNADPATHEIGPDLPPLREVIASFGLDARRSLGQNFLLDLNLTRRIVRAAGELSGTVVAEIGPGPGGLTRALLESPAACIVAVERDTRCIAALQDLSTAYPGRLTVIEGDALAVDLPAECRAAAERCGATERKPKIVANLPYNIGTPLLIGWLRRIDEYGGLTLMFQKEVAERLAAEPGTSAYGRLSIITQWLCEARRLFDVPRQAFVPPPKVTSSVVGLVPRPFPLAEARFEVLEKITAAAFGQRRKMLRSALKTLGADSEGLLRDAGLDPTARAEDIPVAGFCALARAYAARASGG